MLSKVIHRLYFWTLNCHLTKYIRFAQEKVTEQPLDKIMYYGAHKTSLTTLILLKCLYPARKVNSNAYVCQWYLFPPLLHFGFQLVFLFFILCNTIAAYCTSYNGVNVCVGFSLYTQTDTRGIYDIKMYYLLSSIFTGSHNW